MDKRTPLVMARPDEGVAAECGAMASRFGVWSSARKAPSVETRDLSLMGHTFDPALETDERWRNNMRGDVWIRCSGESESAVRDAVATINKVQDSWLLHVDPPSRKMIPLLSP